MALAGQETLLHVSTNFRETALGRLSVLRSHVSEKDAVLSTTRPDIVLILSTFDHIGLQNRELFLTSFNEGYSVPAFAKWMNSGVYILAG